MTRFSQHLPVFFVEEPIFYDGPPKLVTEKVGQHLTVIVPHLTLDMDEREIEGAQRAQLARFFADKALQQPILWFYTPLALPLARDFVPSLTVYDCMDELSAFRGASPELCARERQLFQTANLVFTGGQSLYEAKRSFHPAVHAFPSSVDASHFASARAALRDPADQEALRKPRIGYFGVIDERVDLGLIASAAEQRPDYEFVCVGPVVKISPGELPQARNLHWLGQKDYLELPAYLANWQVATMPFALNEATRFISPTKTLEYLAAGKPVVSTAIRDVVTPYGERQLVAIADRATFPAAIDAALATDVPGLCARADEFLAATSWDKTWSSMWTLMNHYLKQATGPNKENTSCSII